MTFTSWSAAPPDTRIAADAYDDNLGKTVAIFNGASPEPLFFASVIDVEVTEDPHGVSMTFHTDETPLWWEAVMRS